MSRALLLEQLLNGLQYGVFLFLMSAGLTLIFGIMNVINLAHGVLFMIGAYCAEVVLGITHSFLLTLLIAPILTCVISYFIELLVFRHLYGRDHLDQVLATFGVLLFCNRAVVIIFGSASQAMDVPPSLAFTVPIIPDAPYPAYRLLIIAMGLATALGLYVVIVRTRIGAIVRAGASNRVMLSALGVNVRTLYLLVFCASAALAGLAGAIAGPLVSIEPGMGDPVLILAFVVVVIGGLGSIRGAFIASIVVGVVEVFGRTSLKIVLGQFIELSTANAIAPAIASMSVYMIMVLVLIVRPRGLFPSARG